MKQLEILGLTLLVFSLNLTGAPYTIIWKKFSNKIDFEGALNEHPPFLIPEGPTSYGSSSTTAIFGGNWTTMVQTDEGFDFDTISPTNPIEESDFSNERSFLIAWPYIQEDNRQFVVYGNGTEGPAYKDEMSWPNAPTFKNAIHNYQLADFPDVDYKDYSYLDIPNIPSSEYSGGWSGQFWRRSYLGGLSATIITHSLENRDYMVVAYTGENKNFVYSDSSRNIQWKYLNTVFMDKYVDGNGEPLDYNLIFNGLNYDQGGTLAPYTVSGVNNLTNFSDFAFVSIGTLPWGDLSTSGYDWGDAKFWDRGIVAWPARGYTKWDTSLNRRVWTGGKVYHPHIIRANVGDGDYVYILYTDDGGRFVDYAGSLTDDRTGYGTRIIRAPASLAHDASAYEIWDGSWTGRNALPFSISSVVNSLRYSETRYSTTNAAERIMDPYDDYEDGSVVYISSPFKIAKIEGYQKWLMVEHVLWRPVLGEFTRLALRISSDLVNWSDPVYIGDVDAPGYNWNGWGFAFNYPGFANLEGRDSSVIDPDGFYIVASGHSIMKLSIDPDNFVQSELWAGYSKDSSGYRSNWYGDFWDLSMSDPDNAGWYYHSIHGYQVHVGTTEEKFIAYDQGLNRFWSVRSSSYPWVVIYDLNSDSWNWYYYYSGTTPTRVFWGQTEQNYVDEVDLKWP